MLETPPNSAEPLAPPASDDPPGSRSLHARLLGHVHLTVGDRSLPVEVWPRRTARSLLLLLLGTPGRQIGRERAIDLLWPNLAAESAQNTWYQALSTLRRVLEPDLPARRESAFVKVDAASIALLDGPNLWIDVEVFEQSLRRAGDDSAENRRASLRSALTLYQGDLLAEEPADWAIARREEVHLAWQRAVLELADLDASAGEPVASIADLQAVVAADRTVEEAHRSLIRAFILVDEREKAIRQYERCRQALWDDLGIEPGGATRDLVATGSAAARREPSSRLLEPASVPSRLPPTPATPLVGRDREVEQIEDLLWRPDVRLVSLTGPGGVGKTRLAIEVARRADQDDASVVFVPLAGVRSPGLVLIAIGQALGVRDTTVESLLSTVRRHIGERELLLVLDNFEHVVEAAVVVARLLGACPRLCVLTTSRIPLHLGSEHVLAVPPLAVPGTRNPSLAALARSDAVTLFVQRARAAKANFALTEQNGLAIAQLCARLDGLPLAIELAAARVTVLSPQAILARLDQRLDLLTDGPGDAPARLRTMRDAIGWSYDLLDSGHRAVFRRLAVFVGGASLAAARWVTDESGDKPNTGADGGQPDPADAPLAVPEALVALVNHSLLHQEEEPDGEPRFSMLETVRAYAMEQLQASGEADAIHRRHAAYVLAFAQSVVPYLARSAQAAEVERLATEIDNVRAALSWALDQGDGALALQLSTATFQLWFVRAMPGEGRRWLEASLAAAPDAPSLQRTDALLCASAFAFLQGDLPRYLALAEESLAIAQAHGYEYGIAVALMYLGVAAEWQRDLDGAASLYEQALGLMRQIDEPYWVALLLSNLGDVSLWRGDVSEAARLANEGLTLWREIGNEWGIAQGLGSVAAVASERGERVEAARLYHECLQHTASLGDRRGIAGTLAGLAGLAGSVGTPKQAARLLGAARSLVGEVGVSHLAHHIQYERALTATRSQLGERTFAAEWDAGQALSLEEALTEARTLIEIMAMPTPATEAQERAAETVATADAGGADEATPPANVVPLRRKSRTPREA